MLTTSDATTARGPYFQLDSAQSRASHLGHVGIAALVRSTIGRLRADHVVVLFE